MTGTRVGIDLVPLRRAADLLAGDPHVLHRHLSPGEIEDSRRRGALDVSAVAGRLAGKEAVFKLFRSPGAVLPWRGIAITIAAGGWPEVALSGRAAALAEKTGLGTVDLSIAHDDGYAIAAAIAAVGSPDLTSPPDPVAAAPAAAVTTTMKGTA